MGSPKNIGTEHSENEGIQIEYISSRRCIVVFAWYGSYGIDPVAYSLSDFCKKLGIKKSDLEK
jgi:hypothetical protein